MKKVELFHGVMETNFNWVMAKRIMRSNHGKLKLWKMCLLLMSLALEAKNILIVWQSIIVVRSILGEQVIKES
jgi:hypothetical protein